jgi:hypothetical protein
VSAEADRRRNRSTKGRAIGVVQRAASFEKKLRCSLKVKRVIPLNFVMPESMAVSKRVLAPPSCSPGSPDYLEDKKSPDNSANFSLVNISSRHWHEGIQSWCLADHTS